MAENTDFEIHERVTSLEHDLRSTIRRIDTIEKEIADIKNIVTSIKEMVIELKQMCSDINRLDSKVTEIEAKPAKRWESVIAAIIGAVAGGLGTAVLSALIGGG